MPTPERTLLDFLLGACGALAVSVAPGACAGQLSGVVRSQAALDFNCPEDQVEVTDLRSGNSVRDFSVAACGRQEHYQAACSMVGGCHAYRPGEAARHPVPASEALTAGADDLKPGVGATAADEPAGGVTTAVGDAATPGAEAAGDAAAEAGAAADVKPSPAAAGATIATPPPGAERTVTIRNACARRVVFYIGAQPGEDGGSYMTLGSTNMISPRLRVGDHVWLLDAQQAGIASVSVDASTDEIEVAESCAGLAAR